MLPKTQRCRESGAGRCWVSAVCNESVGAAEAQRSLNFCLTRGETMWWEILPSQSPYPPPHEMSKNKMLGKEDSSYASILQLNCSQCFSSACSV